MIRPKDVLTVLWKEIIDLIRDRRTLISMIVVPLIGMPVIITAFLYLSESSMSQAEQKPMKIAIKEVVTLPFFDQALKDSNLEIVKSEDPAKDVRDKMTELGLDISVLNKVKIFFDSTYSFASIAMQRLQKALDRAKESIIKKGILELKIPESILNPFTVEMVNLASEKKQMGFGLGIFLGYIIMLMIFTGGLHAAIDMTAGEKERRTLETLLISPASREDIVLGKIIATGITTFITAILAVVGYLLSFTVNPKYKNLAIAFDAQTIALTLLLMVPIAVLSASLLIGLMIFAKSFKEAQSYTSPLMLVIFFPAMLSFIPGVETNTFLSVIPILNASLLIKQIFTGDFALTNYAVTFLSSFIYALVAFVLAVRTFKSEGVLFRG